MIKTLAHLVFYFIVGVIWVFNVTWEHALLVAGIAALLLAVIYFLDLVGHPISVSRRVE